ncbi:methionine--tRNA ligase [Actinoplanes philippinensis]|uniref:Methionine--tRNA ligase n=1 Tax=Actinoplanes philippinensis TaxID=35752 RepID=A0A1I2J5A4_9ACTN|nr:methionine--tRNA ligase [Actinoplanes philippinensis]GIE79479.1 methionine--tRNA ligase [Actinoplanes philippinensis]SFF49952.1 methionyl-tRNA synthetase [Actinoplanes philippinensis]
MNTFYVTTAIPYVNAAPHLGHALELVQADVLARHARLRGRPVRFLTGTDDNALKNVTAARAAGVDVRDFVDTNAARFAALREPLSLSFDDFIRTSADARHATGVDRLWRECAAGGDFYRRAYQGLYCPGCEQFWAAAELTDGLCPEHRVVPEPVAEENWFFRLSRYTGRILELLESGRLRIEPAARRNEVLAFVRAGLTDFSVSRPAARAGGWGIPVPGDPDQVVYVWWDALANYVTALGYGDGDPAYRRWWAGPGERAHVIGKGIVRFHAVYWPALLLSAGLPLPTAILVHDYLSADGAKLSKSAGNAVDPCALTGRYGTDAVRWWLLREPARVGDTDFTVERLVRRSDGDLANGLGNLVNRTLALAWKHRGGRVSQPTGRPVPSGALRTVCDRLPGQIDRALHDFDFRAATDALVAVVDEGNRFIEAERPWEPAAAGRLDAVLGVLVGACRLVATELSPFLPDGAARLHGRLLTGDRVARPEPVFPRISGPAGAPGTPAGR